ncbi:unnamed protein product [Lactuca virosa]|uniref:Uncharacterized protein n=1 Tax=Lactuca virosa TaxID=75947 RepID=A0AAU9NI99_9ASTR|nr:unnamed protein product [Lactuca virosa]
MIVCVSALLCKKWEFLQHIPMDAVQSSQIYALVSQLLESGLCCSEALSVLEALLHNYGSIHDPVAYYESNLGGVGVGGGGG